MSAENIPYYPLIAIPKVDDPKINNTKVIDSNNKVPKSGNTEQANQKRPTSETKNIDKSTLIDLPEIDVKLLSARDINRKMGDLELHFKTLTKDFSDSQADLNTTLGALESRHVKLDEEIEKVGVTSSLSAQRQAKLSDEIEERLQGKLDFVTGSLEEANGSIVEQSDQLRRLSNVQSFFEEMQHRLEKRADATDEELKALTHDSYQKILANKAHIDNLNAQHNVQKASLVILSEEHDILKGQVNELADKITNIELDASGLKRYTTKGFKIVAGVGISLSIAVASAVTWFELNPTTVPEFVKTELSALVLSLSTLDSSVTEIKSEIGQLSDTRTELTGDVALVKEQVALLEVTTAAVNEHNTAQLGQLSVTLESMQMNMDDLQFQVEGPGNKNGSVTKSLVPLNGVDWVAQRDPAHYSIQLVGSYLQGYLVSYVNQNETVLTGKVLSFTQSQHLQRDWYNLYYGDFTSFTEAQLAMSALPLRLKSNYPWIRSFSSIQESALK